MSIGIIGAGAFGSALAVALNAAGARVTLWGRAGMEELAATRHAPRLPGVPLPENIGITAQLETVCAQDTLLVALPTQSLSTFVGNHAGLLGGKPLVACCKGVDLAALTGPVASILSVLPGATAAILTGPSFAADIARGLPTALTLACASDDAGKALQRQLSTPSLRLYRTTDVIGAELGGALKNVIAIASGVCIGAGLGDSARAALMTRGFAEMQRLALARGARPETLAGLSGFGDLVLTCTSDLSRNFRYGLALGRGSGFDPAVTVEGKATAEAVSKLAKSIKIDMPITDAVTALTQDRLTALEAMQALLSRPLKEE